jgi:hypothetical protein
MLSEILSISMEARQCGLDLIELMRRTQEKVKTKFIYIIIFRMIVYIHLFHFFFFFFKLATTNVFTYLLVK